MPLITPRIIQIYAQFIRPTAIISAGNDINMLCDAIVQLQATINVDEYTHTIEWEQVYGTVVDLYDANTLSPWFINPYTDDLTFRLYVDRGTPYEVSDEVEIYRQPASRGIAGEVLSTRVFRQSLATVAQAGLIVSGRVLPQYYSDNTGSGTEIEGFVRTPSTYMLEWTIPSDVATPHSSQYFESDFRYHFAGVYVQYYNTATQTWQQSAFIPRTLNYYILPFNDGTPYRIAAVWERISIINKDRTRTEIIIVVPNADSWGIYRSLATSPADYNAFVNTGTAMGEARASSPFGFTKTIQNPLKISYLVEDNGAMGDYFATQPMNMTSFRVQGLLAAYESSGVIGTSDFASRQLSITVFRVSGDSIG